MMLFSYSELSNIFNQEKIERNRVKWTHKNQTNPDHKMTTIMFIGEHHWCRGWYNMLSPYDVNEHIVSNIPNACVPADGR